ncbi:MAG TPA: SDR family oxidoreductase [bacterium]|nr:SDR family oxidoreductase [bacterium]HPN44007.1 SDR family oxidoreductase [bacterium]
MKTGKLSEKIIWITGSGRGIGKAAALALAECGARVVLCARSSGEINETATEIHTIGGQVLAIPCNVSDQNQVDALVNRVKQQWGPVDILINNAGVAAFKKIVNTTVQDWDAMLDSNLKAAFLCSQAVLPDMLEKGAGHIINVVSVAGKQPYYNCGAYCASKYGLLGFTEVLRMETRKHGIMVTAFLPGATDTTLWGSANVDRTKMMTTAQVAQGLVNICASEPGCMTEQVIMRPIGGDL